MSNNGKRKISDQSRARLKGSDFFRCPALAVALARSHTASLGCLGPSDALWREDKWYGAGTCQAYIREVSQFNSYFKLVFVGVLGTNLPKQRLSQGSAAARLWQLLLSVSVSSCLLTPSAGDPSAPSTLSCMAYNLLSPASGKSRVGCPDYIHSAPLSESLPHHLL